MYIYIYIYILHKEVCRSRIRGVRSLSRSSAPPGGAAATLSTPNPRYKILVFSDPTLGKSYATTVITYQQMFLGNPTLGESFIT